MTGEVKLKRAISVPLAVAYNIGGVLGTGIYVGITALSLRLGDMMWLPLLLLVPIILADALPYAEMGARFPTAAASFTYMREGFSGLLGEKRGAMLAFIVNFYNTVILSAIIAGGLVPSAFAGYTQAAIRYTANVTIDYNILRFLALAIAAMIAYIGVKESVVAGDIFSWMEVSMCFFVGAVGFLMPTRSPAFLQVGGIAAESGEFWMNLFFALSLSYGFYSGYQLMAGPLAEEIVQPVRRNLPRVIIYTVLISSGIHLWVSTGAQFRIPPEQYAESNSIFADIVRGAFPLPWMPTLIAWLTALAVYNGVIFAFVGTPREWYGMAREGMLPRFLSKLDPKRATPVYAILFMLLLRMTSFLIGGYREILYVLAMATTFRYAALMVAFVGIRYKNRNENKPPPFKAPLNIGWFSMIPPVMFVLFALKFYAESLHPLGWLISFAGLGFSVAAWWIPGLIPARKKLMAS